MKLFLLGLSTLVPSILWGQTSYVAPAELLKENGYQLYLGGEYFKNSKLVDSENKKISLPEGDKFSRIQSEFGGQYGLADNFQVGFGGRFRRHSSTYDDGSGEKTTATSSGLQSIFTEFKLGFKPQKQWQFVVEGLFRYVPYTNDEIDATNVEPKMVLGDDGNEYSLGLATTYSFLSNNYLSARGGWRRPGDGLSTEMYWQVEGALVWRYLALVAGVNGITSLKNDDYADRPTEKPAVNQGASFLYNSINRESVTPYAGVNVALGENWRVELRGAQVVQGRSTDLGTAFGIQIVTRVDKKDPKKVIDSKFKSYDLEATVTKVSPKKNYVVLDKGLADDIEKGMKFDLFEFDYVGGNILVARGVVISTKADTSIVKVTHKFNMKKEIKEGLVGRASLK